MTTQVRPARVDAEALRGQIIDFHSDCPLARGPARDSAVVESFVGVKPA